MDLVAHQACPLRSQILRKFMSTESVMLSNHVVLCHPLLLPSVFPSIRVLTSESALGIRWPECWNFSLSINPFNEYLGLTSWTEASLVGYSPRDRRVGDDWATFTHSFRMGFPGGSDGKESACNVADPGSIPRLGRSPGEGNVNPLQYSGPENSMNYIVHGVTKSRTRRTRLSDFPLSNYPYPFLTWWWEMPLLEAKVSGSPHLRTAFGSACDQSQPSADSWSRRQLCFVWCYLLVSVCVCVCVCADDVIFGTFYYTFCFPWYFFFFFWPCHMACGILVPQPGIKARSWQWKHLVLPTGPSGNSLPDNF